MASRRVVTPSARTRAVLVEAVVADEHPGGAGPHRAAAIHCSLQPGIDGHPDRLGAAVADERREEVGLAVARASLPLQRPANLPHHHRSLHRLTHRLTVGAEGTDHLPFGHQGAPARYPDGHCGSRGDGARGPLPNREAHRRDQPVGEAEPRLQHHEVPDGRERDGEDQRQHETPAKPRSGTRAGGGPAGTAGGCVTRAPRRERAGSVDRKDPAKRVGGFGRLGRGTGRRRSRLRFRGWRRRTLRLQHREIGRLDRDSHGAGHTVPRAEHRRIARHPAGGVGDPHQAAPAERDSSPAGASRPAPASSRSPRCPPRPRPSR